MATRARSRAELSQRAFPPSSRAIPSRGDESMGTLFTELADELSTLMRQELRLAQAELAQKGRQAGRGVGMFGGAGLVGLLALQALTACVIALLSLATPVWVAALIVAVLYTAVAAAMALAGREQLEQAGSPVPEQTKESIKEDVRWAKTQLPSGGR